MQKKYVDKVQLSAVISRDLMLRIDEYAKKMCISRTARISVLCSQALDFQDGLSMLNQFGILGKSFSSEK